jgi:hypothetical protein
LPLTLERFAVERRELGVEDEHVEPLGVLMLRFDLRG